MATRGVPLRPPVRRRVPPPPPPPDPEPDVIDEILEDAAEERSVVFTTRRQYWRGIVWLLIALGVQLIASLMPSVVEQYYSRQAYFYIARYISIPARFTGFVAGEVLLLLLLFWFVLWIVWYVRRSLRRETSLIIVLKIFFLQILWVFTILIPIFLFIWGLNYQRIPLADSLGLERRPATRPGELDAIALQIINGVNSSYEGARKGRDWQGASIPDISRPQMYKLLETGFQNEPLLGRASQGTFGDPKPLLLTKVAGWTGMTGFFIAYTGEVAFNADLPACDLPMVLAHHKAHQRGYAREDEANFIAYLICTKSPEPYIQYSGYLYGLKMIEPLSESNQERYASLISRVGPGPRADLQARALYWGAAKSRYVGQVPRRLFSAYLRANRVHGGIKNYDEDIYLLTSYYLRNLSGLAPTPFSAPTRIPDTGRDTEPGRFTQ